MAGIPSQVQSSREFENRVMTPCASPIIPHHVKHTLVTAQTFNKSILLCHNWQSHPPTPAPPLYLQGSVGNGIATLLSRNKNLLPRATNLRIGLTSLYPTKKEVINKKN